MIHIVFERPQKIMKAYHRDGSLRFVWDASGAAAEHSNGPMPSGHYILLEPELFPQSQRTADLEAEGLGWGRVRIRDMTASDASLLCAAGKAKADGATLVIGSIGLPLGECDAYQRGIEIHGGGSALGYPGCYAERQRLCVTLGCTRLHNEDLAELIQYINDYQASDTVVLSALGAPGACSC